MMWFEEFQLSRVREYQDNVKNMSQCRHVVLLGDSITEGFPQQTLLDGTFAVFNQGISGDMVNRPDGGLFRRLDVVTASAPEWVFLLIGINDLIFGDHDLDRIKREYPEIVKTLVKNNAPRRVCIQTIMPTGREHLKYLPDVVELNEMIRANFQAWGAAAMLDTFRIMGDPENNMALTDSLTYDGLHLSEQGYAKWIAELNRFLKDNA